jgi:hypothetical protein
MFKTKIMESENNEIDALSAKFGGIALDTSSMIHNSMVRYYEDQYQQAVNVETHLNTRFEECDIRANNNQVMGDELLIKLNDLFFNGLGLQWSITQQKIFNAFVDSCLPRIYGTGVWVSKQKKPYLGFFFLTYL